MRRSGTCKVRVCDDETHEEKEIELPVLSGTMGARAIDVRGMKEKSGVVTFDAGFTATASCSSAITFIDGEAGTTGLQIRERLAMRADIELLSISEDLRKDKNARADLLNAADAAILCLPDAAAKESVSLIENDTTRVIDASTAHRVAEGWDYGFAWYRFTIRLN